MSTIENLDTITQESHEEVICDIDNIEINDETEYFDCNGSDSPKKQEETTKSIGKLQCTFFVVKLSISNIF